MQKCRYPIATDQGTEHVNGYRNGPDSLLAIGRDGNVGPWTITFLPCGTSINSLFQAERYMSSVYLLQRIERLERDSEFAWACLSALPFGTQDAKAIPEIAWAINAIKMAAAQP